MSEKDMKLVLAGIMVVVNMAKIAVQHRNAIKKSKKRT